MYRNELSGVLHGMLRVRGFTQDDAHIFCTPAQIQQEVAGALDLVLHVMKTFGYDEYRIDLSLHDADDFDKYAGDAAEWALAEGALAEALDSMGLAYQRQAGEAAFYGPKIGLSSDRRPGARLAGSDGAVGLQPARAFRSHLRRRRRQAASRGNDPSRHLRLAGTLRRRAHRTLRRGLPAVARTGAGDRSCRSPTIATWNMPSKLPPPSTTPAYGFRSTAIAASSAPRIRDAQMQKIPFMLIVGDRDMEQGMVSVRHRTAGDLGSQSTAEFARRAIRDIERRAVREWPLGEGSRGTSA